MMARQPVSIDERVKEAFERNGINTLLLDIKEGLSDVVEKLQALAIEHAETRTELRHVQRELGSASQSRTDLHHKVNAVTSTCAELKNTMARIVPMVDRHEDRHQQEIGERRFWTRTKAMLSSWWTTIAALVGGGGLTAYINLDTIKLWLRGGP